MNEERLKLVKDQLMVLLHEIQSSGEEPPPEVQALLIEAFSKIRDKVHEARQAEAATALGPNIGAPPSNDAQLLWMLAGQQEQPFLSYLREFGTQETNALLSNPSELSRTIYWLTVNFPPGQLANIDGIQEADLQSSNIWGMAYDQKSGKMKVRFQGGSEYEYDGIPPNIFRAFQKGNASAKTKGKNQYGEWWKNKNPSLGASFNQYIKAGGFNYRKIK